MLSPLRGSGDKNDYSLRAYARSYVLSPLRGWPKMWDTRVLCLIVLSRRIHRVLKHYNPQAFPLPCHPHGHYFLYLLA